MSRCLLFSPFSLSHTHTNVCGARGVRSRRQKRQLQKGGCNFPLKEILLSLHLLHDAAYMGRKGREEKREAVTSKSGVSQPKCFLLLTSTWTLLTLVGRLVESERGGESPSLPLLFIRQTQGISIVSELRQRREGGRKGEGAMTESPSCQKMAMLVRWLVGRGGREEKRGEGG